MFLPHGTGAKVCRGDSRDRKFGAVGLGDFGDPSLESDLEQHVKSYRDQRATNSCGGQAFAGAIDIITSQSNHAADYGTASALFLYYLAVRSWGIEMVDEGIDARSVVRVLQKQGCTDEKLWPFSEDKVFEAPSWSAIFGAHGRSGCSYAFVRERGEERLGGLAAALHAGHPVVVGLDLERSFFSYSGIDAIEKPKGSIVGKHFVLLIGRKDEAFKFLNSWGTSWGARGTGWLTDNYIDSDRCWDPCVIYGFDRARER